MVTFSFSFGSSRYQFSTAWSGGYDGKEAIADRYPRGMRTVCYVNPKDPTDAVIERGYTWELLVGLIPLVFVGIGGVGLVRTLRRRVHT